MATVATDIPSSGSSARRVIELTVLTALGVELPKTARILDFGCGFGGTLKALRALGYVNTFGYDVEDTRAGRTRKRLGADRGDNISVGTLLDLRLPYEDNTFDLVISDQVFEHVQDQGRVFQELLRITKPGGHGLHIIPARYMPIEGHIFVPFGGVLKHRWWYKLWASLGIRNESQAGLSADETADDNAYFMSDATRYISTSCYRVMWKKIGFEYRFAEQEFFDSHPRPSMRMIGRLGRPAMCLYRTFRSRIVHLRKPGHPPIQDARGRSKPAERGEKSRVTDQS
ncbi:MAG TPA: class I SAM-dependent methyltransferase [Steroidobacteraceae bacterium]|nr:class I SAM-dependent methyltransferase [Steroidobacteraceae bacterium]